MELEKLKFTPDFFLPLLNAAFPTMAFLRNRHAFFNPHTCTGTLMHGLYAADNQNFWFFYKSAIDGGYTGHYALIATAVSFDLMSKKVKIERSQKVLQSLHEVTTLLQIGNYPPLRIYDAQGPKIVLNKANDIQQAINGFNYPENVYTLFVKKRLMRYVYFPESTFLPALLQPYFDTYRGACAALVSS
jgi:hypothetical protein